MNRCLFWSANFRNVLLFVLAVGIASLVFLTVGKIYGSPDTPMKGEKYPFSSTPEFPVAGETDEEGLRSAVTAFLQSPEWGEVHAQPEGWQFADLASLTLGGARVGVYGDVVFHSPILAPAPSTFIRCGLVESWWREKEPLFYVGGLRIWLLDGDSLPHHVLPLNSEMEIPRYEELLEFNNGVRGCGLTSGVG